MARRDVDAVLPQLLQQQGFRDHRLMVLVQNVSDQVGSKVPALDRQDSLRQRRQQRTALGQVIACPQITRVFVLDDEFLDYVRLVALERGAGGKVFGVQLYLVVNGELGSFRPLR